MGFPVQGKGMNRLIIKDGSWIDTEIVEDTKTLESLVLFKRTKLSV